MWFIDQRKKLPNLGTTSCKNQDQIILAKFKINFETGDQGLKGSSYIELFLNFITNIIKEFCYAKSSCYISIN